MLLIRIFICIFIDDYLVNKKFGIVECIGLFFEKYIIFKLEGMFFKKIIKYNIF